MEVRDRVGAAVAAGVDPASPQAAAIVDALATRYAQTFGRADDARLRDWMLDRLRTADEPLAERYLRLLAVING